MRRSTKLLVSQSLRKIINCNMRRRIFLISLGVMFVFTLLLCIITKQPLLFKETSYNLNSIVGFLLSLSFWCFLLVYVSLPFVNLFKPEKLKSHQYEAFFMLAIFVLLQFVTLLFGYLESSFTNRPVCRLVLLL